MLDAVLFDLDGTLADTAPDLGAATNRVLEEEGRPALPLATLRPYTSSGVRGLLRASFDIGPDDRHYERLAARFLEHYEARLCEDTVLFAGIAELIDTLACAGALSPTSAGALPTRWSPAWGCHRARPVSSVVTRPRRPSPPLCPYCTPAVCWASRRIARSTSVTTCGTFRPDVTPVAARWPSATAISATAARWAAGVPT